MSHDVGVSRAFLARLALGAAVATCGVCAVLTLVTLPGVAPVVDGAVTAARPSAAAELATVPAGERVVVVRVVDAVTFDARLPDGGGVVRVRALGVQPPGECYGPQATSFASRVLGGQAVALLPGPGAATDRFDRRLATAGLSSGDYAVLAAEAGIARAYTADGVADRMPAIRAAQDRARTAGRGVWAAPCLGAETVPGARPAAGPSRTARGDATDSSTSRRTPRR